MIFKGPNYHSKPIIPKRGLRQGDPLSPLLYNLSLDPLLRILNSTMKGIIVRGQPPLKAIAYADNCVIGLGNNMDSQTLAAVITQYIQASNAALSIDKTEVITLDRNPLGNKSLPFSISSISADPVRHLGVWIDKDGYANDHMEHIILANITKRAASSTGQGISLTGKVIAANTFCCPKFGIWHTSSLFQSNFSLNLLHITELVLDGSSGPSTSGSVI